MSEIVVETKYINPKPYVGDVVAVLLPKSLTGGAMPPIGWTRSLPLLDWECFIRMWDGTEPQIHSFYTTADIGDDGSRTIPGGVLVGKQPLVGW